MARVLVIGSDADLIRALQSHRPLAGCEIISVPTNVEALRTLRVRSYDLVVTDLDSSVGEDLALVEEMRAIRPGLRAIILSPETTPQEVIAALRSQIFAAFSTPFAPAELAAMIVLALEQDRWRDGIEVTSSLPDWIQLRMACNLINGERLVRFMTEHRSDLPQEERDNLMSAFREVLMNAMEHGAGFDDEKVLELSAARTQRAIVYHFRDPGTGFDPASLPQAAVSNPPDKPLAHLEYRIEHGMRPGGFGILIAKQLVDELVYNERGNEVVMIKYID